ncbi:hypothetical protein D9756_005880 [Leucocoprinus leucothites]|uniref:Fatty acid desaturase domain-containing protein n=1 Tax=Leucocoprinus leucothites TaxID=201217 RepID=A0A8H5D3F4_9AGAR|nr:hypothetical protein D9756_005880 [Leucoagaricus leucothites]
MASFCFLAVIMFWGIIACILTSRSGPVFPFASYLQPWEQLLIKVPFDGGKLNESYMWTQNKITMIPARCLRHRLHHRFTDDPIHDPYAATRGLLYSHVGWIFLKPTYGKLDLIETDDLDNDPVVRIQHRYYHLLALLLGFCLPAVAGSLWEDAFGGFIWGGLVARVFVWHCTFFVNSLAHWNGLQPYSDENTSRGNLVGSMSLYVPAHAST